MYVHLPCPVPVNAVRLDDGSKEIDEYCGAQIEIEVLYDLGDPSTGVRAGYLCELETIPSHCPNGHYLKDFREELALLAAEQCTD